MTILHRPMAEVLGDLTAVCFLHYRRCHIASVVRQKEARFSMLRIGVLGLALLAGCAARQTPEVVVAPLVMASEAEVKAGRAEAAAAQLEAEAIRLEETARKLNAIADQLEAQRQSQGRGKKR